MNKTDLRKEVRRRRRALTPSQRQQAAFNLLRNLRHFPHFQSSQHIAIYLTNDGEIDTSVLIADLQKRGKTLYLPVLHPFKSGHLSFIRWHSATRMTTNKFNIPEPSFNSDEIIPTAMLQDRKSTRLNSSHVRISYAVFCLKKKNKNIITKNTFY